MQQTLETNKHITPAHSPATGIAPARTDWRRFAGLLAAVLVLSFLIRLVFLNSFVWGYDEGIHVLLAQLLADGYAPYSELFVSYPPVFVWALEWPWRIWRTVAALQLTMSGLALLGVAAAGVIAFRLGGTLAGVLAALILSVSAAYLDGSRAVMTEVPSIGVAVLSVGLAALYDWRGGRGWLLASGLAMSASLMLKILSPFVLVLIPLMILARQIETVYLPQRRWKPTLRSTVIDGTVWGIALLAPILITLIIYDAEAMYRQNIAFRIASRLEYAEDSGENIQMLAAFSRYNLPLLLAALWGIGLITTRQLRNGWFVVVWLLLSITFAMMQVPLRDKHLPLLLPPLSVLAALALAVGLRYLSSLQERANAKTVLSSAMAVLLLLGWLWQIGHEFSAYRTYAAEPLNEENRMLADFIQKFTAPDDCLVTDNPTLAFFTGRPVPPNLSEISSARLRSGYLTYDELVEATESYRCQIVAPVDKRLKRTRPDFVEWSKQNFISLWLYDGSTEILLAQPLAQPQPAVPLHATLGEQVELLGYDTIDADDGLYVSLYWRALRRLSKDYAIFVHLRDADNRTIANADHQPYGGHAPTSRWPGGAVIKETIRLDLPPDLPDGAYRIMVGMYAPDTLERLPVQADSSGESAIVLEAAFRP